MPPALAELLAAGIISTLLVGIGIFYLAREYRSRRAAEEYRNLPPDDYEHFRRQYHRRRLGSILLILTGMAIFVSLTALNPDRVPAPRLFAWVWIGIMLALLWLLALAFMDIVAIRRYARRHQRRLLQDREAMIARQLEAYRTERSRDETPPDWTPERN